MKLAITKAIQRIKSHLATKEEAQEKLNDLIIELRSRGINFKLEEITEDNGKKYYYATSVNFAKGYISATGKTLEELEYNLKDAIFTAFSVPVNYCLPQIINFDGALERQPSKLYATT